MHGIIRQISDIGIVPVIALNDVEKAVPLAKALAAGGIPCAEVTFRTAQGEEGIRRIAAEAPGVLLGAGTVLTTEQVDRAVAAGAKFIVSPGFNPRVVAHCADKGVPITPGCSSPTDIEQALEHGLDVVKFFPAEQSGGLDYIKAVAAPYPTVRFMPTGGINAANIATYLAHEKIVACGGSWMVRGDLIEAGNFAEITRLCVEAVRASLGFALEHVGINAGDGAQAAAIAGLFGGCFGFPVKEYNGSVFAGRGVEVMKPPYRGEKGHIAIGTVNARRAMAHLRRQGVAFDGDSAKYDAEGNLKLIYLKEQFGGFAVHLFNR